MFTDEQRTEDQLAAVPPKSSQVCLTHVDDMHMKREERWGLLDLKTLSPEVDLAGFQRNKH